MLKKTDLGVGLYLLLLPLVFYHTYSILPVRCYALHSTFHIALIILFKVLFKKKCLICHFPDHYYTVYTTIFGISPHNVSSTGLYLSTGTRVVCKCVWSIR